MGMAPLGVRVALAAALVVAGLTGLMIAGAFFKLLLYGLYSFDGSDVLFFGAIGLAFWLSVSYLKIKLRKTGEN